MLEVSVVICTHNRPSLLMTSLLHLMTARVPVDLAWECLVVDNASSRGWETAQFIRRFARKMPVRYLWDEVPGLSHARNTAIARATGAVIAFLDDDVTVEDNWFVRLRSAWAEHPEAAAIGGRV